ncbi:MAG: isochorismatase family protein [Candidatus Limnocylindria bacterium]
MATYDPATALLVVDVQNDFASPQGSLSVRSAEAIIPVLNAEVDAAVSSDAPVVFTQDWHPEATPHFAKDGGIWPVHCVRETWGAELHPALDARGPVVRKGTGGEDGYSGFSVRDPVTGDRRATELDGLLRARGVARLVIAGLATDYCVRETALDARRLGYATAVITDAVRAVDLEQGDGERALADMREAGVELI